eukprot:GILJ01008854.1.p1 GENE.GILJ01008854.1~~GILJ01008854.1.p1  ORF type:complete len:231 (+),score=16.89 GILJ01008854.1:54-746(+)
MHLLLVVFLSLIGVILVGYGFYRFSMLMESKNIAEVRSMLQWVLLISLTLPLYLCVVERVSVIYLLISEGTFILGYRPFVLRFPHVSSDFDSVNLKVIGLTILNCFAYVFWYPPNVHNLGSFFVFFFLCVWLYPLLLILSLPLEDEVDVKSMALHNKDALDHFVDQFRDPEQRQHLKRRVKTLAEVYTDRVGRFLVRYPLGRLLLVKPDLVEKYSNLDRVESLRAKTKPV